MPNGSKRWRIKYRFDGKRETAFMWHLPDTSLAKAREKRDEARKPFADGVDPGEHRSSKSKQNS